MKSDLNEGGSRVCELLMTDLIEAKGCCYDTGNQSRYAEGASEDGIKDKEFPPNSLREERSPND